MFNLDLVNEVLDFIEETKSLFELEDLPTTPQAYFTRGGCGEFYRILKTEYPQAKMFLTEDLGHVLTEIGGLLFDVNGVYEYDFVVEAPPVVEKVTSWYAFSLKSDCPFTGGQGPTGAYFFHVLDKELSETERETFMDYCYNIGVDYFYDDYLDYKAGFLDPILRVEEQGIPTLSF